MKDDFSQIMTPLDITVSSRSLQMTKLLIPFLPPHTQRMLAIYVKFLEFQNTFTYFSGFHSTNTDPFEELKKVMPSSAMETYDNLMNMMSMVNMFQDMQDFDPSMMADLFSQEQKEGETNDGLVK